MTELETGKPVKDESKADFHDEKVPRLFNALAKILEENRRGKVQLSDGDLAAAERVEVRLRKALNTTDEAGAVTIDLQSSPDKMKTVAAALQRAQTSPSLARITNFEFESDPNGFKAPKFSRGSMSGVIESVTGGLSGMKGLRAYGCSL